MVELQIDFKRQLPLFESHDDQMTDPRKLTNTANTQVGSIMCENFNQPVFPAYSHQGQGHMSVGTIENQAFAQPMVSNAQDAGLSGELHSGKLEGHIHPGEMGGIFSERHPHVHSESRDGIQTNFAPSGDRVAIVIGGETNNIHEADNGLSHMQSTISDEQGRTTGEQSEVIITHITSYPDVGLDNMNPEVLNDFLKDNDNYLSKEENSGAVNSDIIADGNEDCNSEPAKPIRAREILESSAEESQDHPYDTGQDDLDTDKADVNGNDEDDVVGIEVTNEEHESRILKNVAATEKDTVISDVDTFPDEEQTTDCPIKSRRKTKAKSVSGKPVKEKPKSKSAVLYEKKAHKCPVCGRIVQSLRALKKHMNLHTNKFLCNICAKCFNSQTSLEAHHKIHEGFVGKEQCNVCDKTFFDKSSLNKHTLSVHMGITNFTCEYCDKSFFAKKTYEEHVRVHTGERPFKCTLCPKAYKRIADLNHHTRLHKGEMKHTCEFCGEGFRRISELNRHMQKHETTGEVKKLSAHVCEWCELRFSTGKALKEHHTVHFESTNCDKSMMQKAYGPDQTIVDRIDQEYSAELLSGIIDEEWAIQNATHKELTVHNDQPVTNTMVGLTSMIPNFSMSANTEQHDANTSDPPIPSVHPCETQSTFDKTILLTETRVQVGDTVRKQATDECHEDNQWTGLDDQSETPDPDENGSMNVHPIDMSTEEFEIKVENVEEDGTNHFYIRKQTVFDIEHASDGSVDDYSDIHVKQDYGDDTEVEEYSYIIKNDGNDSIEIPKQEYTQTRKKPNKPQSRKRKRKGQPLRKPKQSKIMKVVDYEESSEIDDCNETDVIDNDELDQDCNDTDVIDNDELDQDYTPSASRSKETKSGKNKVNRENQLLPIKKEPDIPDSLTYFCEECGKVFKSKQCFKKHQNIHSGMFACGHCGRGCSSRHALEIHEASHEGKKPAPSVCQVCDKQFYDSSSMNKHVRTVHMNYRPHPCTECDLKFPERKTLDEHMRTHTGERPFKCEICEKSYKRKSELNFHTKWHTGEKNITCGECGKGFRRMSELKHHNVVHHDAERPFQCTLCIKKFSTKSQLNEHSLRHNHIKEYECQKCLKAFYTKSKLMRHLRTKTSCSRWSILSNGLFMCSVCEGNFKTQEELRVHIKTSHDHGKQKNTNHTCKVCLKVFSRGQHLKRHAKIHTQTRDFLCNTCGAGFIQKHHLAQHMRTHTGEKPFQCMVCLRSFAQSATLYSHMKHHNQSGLELYRPTSPFDDDNGLDE